MDLCGRSWRRVIPEAGGKWPSPPHRSRVNGWSRPLHSFQVVAWVTVLVMAIANFGIFIPFLPRDWKYVAYGVSFTMSKGGSRGPPPQLAQTTRALGAPRHSVLCTQSPTGAASCPLTRPPTLDSPHGHSTDGSLRVFLSGSRERGPG